jgi:hypothetical protein
MSGYRPQSFAGGHSKLGFDGGVKASAGQLEDLGARCALRADKDMKLCSRFLDGFADFTPQKTSGDTMDISSFEKACLRC